MGNLRRNCRYEREDTKIAVDTDKYVGAFSFEVDRIQIMNKITGICNFGYNLSGFLCFGYNNIENNCSSAWRWNGCMGCHQPDGGLWCG